MDREQLETWLSEGLSVAGIARHVDRDPSTVSYWLKKHGLTPNGSRRHAAKGSLRREQLAPLVAQGATLAEIASEVGRSMSTVRYWLRAYELERPIAVRRRDRDDALEIGLRTVERHCRRHGTSTFVIENSGRVRCRHCRMEGVARRRRRLKEILVEEAGGACRLCGYRRCMAALQFHHLDPSKKAFHLSVRGCTKGIAQLRREAAKCVLLCANCHAEVEAGFVKIGPDPP